MKIFIPSFRKSQKLQVGLINGKFVAWPVGIQIHQTKNSQIHKFSKNTKFNCTKRMK